MAKQNQTRYVPGPASTASTPDEVMAYVLRELRAVSSIINNIAPGQAEVCYAPPDKPQPGWIRYADGTFWNPGSGRGFYGYVDGSGWRFLG